MHFCNACTLQCILILIEIFFKIDEANVGHLLPGYKDKLKAVNFFKNVSLIYKFEVKEVTDLIKQSLNLKLILQTIYSFLIILSTLVSA